MAYRISLINPWTYKVGGGGGEVEGVSDNLHIIFR